MEDCAKKVNDEMSKWYLNVEDLWFENKLRHLREVSTPLTHDQVLNPITEKYGFQIDNETVLENGSVEMNFHKDTPLEPQEVQQQDQTNQPPVSAEGNNVFTENSLIKLILLDDLSTIAKKLGPTDISNYLRSLKLDRYIEAFEECEVDGSILYDIDDETLKSLGVDTMKDKIKIKNKFKQWLRDLK